LYTQLDDHQSLLKSNNYAAKCFGAWWILHLLWGEYLKYYTRTYTELCIKFNVFPTMYDIISRDFKEGNFLHQLCLECLFVASTKSFAKPLLVEQGLWRVLDRISQLKHPAADYLLYHIINNKEHYKYPEAPQGQPAKLTHLTTNFICENTDIEDHVQFLNLTSSTSLYRLSMYFLTSVVQSEATPEVQAKLGELNEGLKGLVTKLSEISKTFKEPPSLYPGRHDPKELPINSDIFKNF